MGPTRTSGRGGRTRATATAAVCLLALGTLTAGCRVEPAGAAGTPAPMSPATDSAHPTDDAKPGGGPTSASPSRSASPSPSPSTASPSASASAAPDGRSPDAPPPPEPETLMKTGDDSDRVRELQARLRQIGHFDRSPTGYYGTTTEASVRSFQAKRGLSGTGRTDAVTWERLLGMTREPTAAELRPPTEREVAKPDPRCMTGRVLCISKNSRTLAWMIDGRVVSSMDVRFGSQYTPTREGTFAVYWKSRHHVSTLYDSPMPYAMFFSGGQAVHYSSDFAARGYSGASHGCVNVRDEAKIASLYAQVKNGDKVVVYH
ncbi:L,D-transpeptidase family protein [Streptomyces sp. NBC_01754]|uniref:L,D-transpeptidase family protein n=1 Tax=Streptomyces sp. NBC_01754 TaxID=2975930 RepID=UPI002DDB1BA7|nr:L,D-transpeptidase family protein [Streptomyces sp. NBC_01754]WSC94447.1 L,D-transpeptidase family protein [Streptomyces sp. NBC_01754]